jgi:hypothetical protein
MADKKKAPADDQGETQQESGVRSWQEPADAPEESSGGRSARAAAGRPEVRVSR